MPNSEFGTTKLGDNPPLLETHKIARTNWFTSCRTGELAHTPGAYIFFFFQSGACALVSSLFFLPDKKNLLCFHSYLSLNFFLDESRPWRSPNMWKFLDRAGAGPARPTPTLLYRNISTYKKIFAVNSVLCYARSSFRQLFNFLLIAQVSLVLDLILCCIRNRFIA